MPTLCCVTSPKRNCKNGPCVFTPLKDCSLPPRGPRSKAQYRYEHLVILVALRLFKYLGMKLDLIEEVIRARRAEGIEKLAETVQQYLDKMQKSRYAVAEQHDTAFEDRVADQHFEDLFALHMQPLYLASPLSALHQKPSQAQPAKKTIRLQLTPDIALEFNEEKPLQMVLLEAYYKIKKLLGRTS
ncbi:MAG: hypothetical protein KatS3mg022_1837 [Armatimonadota bacterium]|nr:MAG: hypothetical protein KatS3mg022_1837 [Armatimonadota bacterium]